MQAEAVKATRRRTVWNVLRRNLSLTAGCLILLCVVFTALFPGLIASQSPTDQNLTAMLAAPSAQHIWGTDELGRDIFARVIWGTRYDLVIGLAAASIPFVVGTLIGLFTAYFGGILDTLFMRLVDVMMSFPVIVLIIAIVAVLGPGIGNMYLAMWLVGWTSYARLVRSAYKLLGLQSYFTSGKTETRAWTIPIGAKAPQAAGVIHSDFERGFIKAETASYSDYVELGGELGCRNAGKLRQEGKEYVVQDGDVMHFKFNV